MTDPSTISYVPSPFAIIKNPAPVFNQNTDDSKILIHFPDKKDKLSRPTIYLPNNNFQFDNDSYISGYYALSPSMYLTLKGKLQDPNIKVLALVADTTKMNNELCIQNTTNALQMMVDVVSMFIKNGIDIRFANQDQSLNSTLVNSIEKLDNITRRIHWRGDNVTTKSLINIVNTAISTQTTVKIIYFGCDSILDLDVFVETIVKGFQFIPNFRIKIFNVCNTKCYDTLKTKLKKYNIEHCVYSFEPSQLFVHTVRDRLIRM